MPNSTSDARAPDLIEQELHRGDRARRALPGIEEAGGEAALQVGLQPVDAVAVEALVTFRQAGEVVDLALVARAGDDQRAVEHGAGIGVAPQANGREAQVAHDRGIDLLLAEGPQHGAGIGAGGVRERLGRLLDQPHASARGAPASAPARGR